MSNARRRTIGILCATLWVAFEAGPATAQAVPQGGSIAVNSVAAGDQELPAVAATPDGGFAVVWLTREAGLEGIAARLLDPMGEPLGNDIVLEAPQGAERVRWPRVVARGDSEVVAAWFQNPGPLFVPGPVKIRRFDAAGAILGDLDSPAEDDGVGQPPIEHDLAAFDDGSLALVWRQGPADAGFTNEQVFARLYDPAGEPTPEFQVNTTEGFYYGAQVQPSVAAGGGEFVVVWEDRGAEIGFRRYAAGGDALGPAQYVGPVTRSDQKSEPQVAAGADGSFVVTWTERADPASDLDVWARHFVRPAAGESPVPGQPFRVNPSTDGDQQAPDVAMDPAGNFVIVWRSDLDSDRSHVEGRLFQRFGAPVGDSFRVAADAAADARPSVALTGSGQVLVVWHQPGVDGDGTGIAGRRYTATFSDCVEDSRSLCLQRSRFRVEVAWRDFLGATGAGHKVEQARSDDSGLFWFFSPSNWELLVKVLRGCEINGHFWVFAAATTTVEYTLTVTDTSTGEKSDYVNPLGVSSSAVTDTSAFATCSVVP